MASTRLLKVSNVFIPYGRVSAVASRPEAVGLLLSGSESSDKLAKLVALSVDARRRRLGEGSRHTESLA